MKPIPIYTDGSCKGNPGPGGWAAVMVPRLGFTPRFIRGGETRTTNNRMELMAAIKGLVAVQDIFPLATYFIIYSDSTYLVNTMTKGWKRRANRDLWEQLDDAARGKHVSWRWVKGHSGDPGNEMADTLAQEEAERWRSTTT